MVLYLDTSSLVKLYVEEDGSPEVESLVKSSEVAATSIVAYAEARAAFARRYREKAFTRSEYDIIKSNVTKDWRRYLVLSITGDLVRMAGDLAEKHALRGFDAIHLASALTLRDALSTSILFSCFDDYLQNAFKLEDFTVE
jgi:predicted nucleic acid-binding protein